MPLCKKGDKIYPGYYRPVSLTSVYCKVMEHSMLSKFNKMLEGKINYSQHGFRKGLSCTTQFVTTIHNMMRIADSGKKVHAAVLDFSAAFYRVSRQTHP